jgi:alpha-tubulin suppressor-like RCC1 family protein
MTYAPLLRCCLVAALSLVALAAGSSVLLEEPPGADASGGVSAISIGLMDTCAVMDDGELLCWGASTYSNTPVSVPDLTDRVLGVSVGQDAFTCVVTTSNGAKCWGSNTNGQLGNTDICDYSFYCDSYTLPVDVTGLTSGVASITTGGRHACAVTVTGAAKCWGGNFLAQLGDGHYTELTPPGNTVVGLSSGVASISAGLFHTCALTTAGGVKCWGHNRYGELGIGENYGPQNCGEPCSATPQDVIGLQTGVTSISSGHGFSCALTNAGAVKCWGYNAYGQLGIGTKGSQSTPQDVLGLSTGVVAIATGAAHSCALMDDGTVKCWGFNDAGQLGTGTDTGPANCPDFSSLPAESCHLAPVDVVGLQDVVAIEAGNQVTCAVLAAGDVKCWGQNLFGQLGIGTTDGPEQCDQDGANPLLFGCSTLPLDVQGLTKGGEPTPTSPAEHTPTRTPTPPPGEATPTRTPTPRRTPTPSVGQPGDANGDGRVDSIDAALVLQYSAGLLGSLPSLANSDVNRDGRTNAIDAQLVLQFVAGILPSLL